MVEIRTGPGGSAKGDEGPMIPIGKNEVYLALVLLGLTIIFALFAWHLSLTKRDR
jgi:hypothetical protein